MPKRKHDDLESLSYIKKKIKKLERRLLKGRRRISSSSESENSEQLSSKIQDDTYIESDDDKSQTKDGSESSFNPTGTGRKSSHAEDRQRTNLGDATSSQPMAEETPAIEKELHTQELDELVLEILGADPSATTVFGKDIQKDLAVRFQFIATSGLTKELRKELIEAHLTPANCKMIDAPALNPEIKAAVTDVIIKRDKAMQAKQKQICSAIACLSEAITLLLAKDTKDPTILKLLMDTGRILCDSQHNDSLTRRNFILAVLKKELKDQMQSTRIDSLLFGQELADALKTAKAINKSGADLKPITPRQSSTTNSKPPPSNKNLNWKAPAPNRRSAGPPKAKDSAPPTRQQHRRSSRGSRASTSRGRRR